MVFIARINREDKAAWKPFLNREHREWRWFKLDEAAARQDLHPILLAALQAEPFKQAVVEAVISGAAE